MDKNTALKMIDDYLTEPNGISREWVECLIYCRECIKREALLKEENEALNRLLNATGESK
jgi:hypothetical protein